METNERIRYFLSSSDDDMFMLGVTLFFRCGHEDRKKIVGISSANNSVERGVVSHTSQKIRNLFFVDFKYFYSLIFVGNVLVYRKTYTISHLGIAYKKLIVVNNKSNKMLVSECCGAPRIPYLYSNDNTCIKCGKVCTYVEVDIKEEDRIDTEDDSEG